MACKSTDHGREVGREVRGGGNRGQPTETSAKNDKARRARGSGGVDANSPKQRNSKPGGQRGPANHDDKKMPV